MNRLKNILQELHEESVKKYDLTTDKLEDSIEEIKLKDKLREACEIKESNSRINDSVIGNLFKYGFIGLLIGSIIGFGKGCKNYDVGVSDFLDPFIYIPGGALFGSILGCLFGILYGLYRGFYKI